MTNTNKKAAEILVECGYCPSYITNRLGDYTLVVGHGEYCNPFMESLEARKQADAIEDYLHDKHPDILEQSKRFCRVPRPYNGRQKRLDRIDWVLKKLTEVEL